MSPADYVISVFGGVTETAAALKRDPSSVSRWNYYVPQKLHKKIIALAKKRKIDITERDLVQGR